MPAATAAGSISAAAKVWSSSVAGTPTFGPISSASGGVITIAAPNLVVPRTSPPASAIKRLQVFNSDRYVLVGPSGCGKSTLLKAVGGYLALVEGSIHFDSPSAFAKVSGS